MYSLISASTLGFDLLRRPGGARVGSLLAAALSLGEADLPVLAGSHRDDAARTEAWSHVMAAESSVTTMRSAMRAAVELTADPRDIGTATLLLERTAIGNLAGLLRCIRYDVFDWTWDTSGEVALHDERADRAVAVVCDAAAGGYHCGSLPAGSARRLHAGWVTGRRALALGVVLPQPPEQAVQHLLDRLSRLDAPARQALRDAAQGARGSGAAWAAAMHEATWAVYLSGRVRGAARVQLIAMDAFARAGLAASDAAGGVWNLVSGALQGLVVRDLVDDSALERLTSPLEASLGPFAG
jgi:hypothetical protein